MKSLIIHYDFIKRKEREHMKTFTLRLPDYDAAILDRISKMKGVSKNNIILSLIGSFADAFETESEQTLGILSSNEEVIEDRVLRIAGLLEEIKKDMDADNMAGLDYKLNNIYGIIKETLKFAEVTGINLTDEQQKCIEAVKEVAQLKRKKAK